jgi:hypothetical protein
MVGSRRHASLRCLQAQAPHAMRRDVEPDIVTAAATDPLPPWCPNQMTVMAHRALVFPLPPPPSTSSTSSPPATTSITKPRIYCNSKMADSVSRIEQAGHPSQESGGTELPSIPRVPAVASPSTAPMLAVVRGAYQVGRNIYHYPQPGILANQTSAAVMSGVHTMFKAAQAEASTWGFRLSQRVFRKLLVEEASISVVGSRNEILYCPLSFANISTLSHSPALTWKRASRPHASSHSSPFYDPN